MDKGISVVLLAYKEAENLTFLLPQIIKNLEIIDEEYEILVIDTEQPLDNTKEVCLKYGVKYINQEYPGFGGAFKTAIKYASKEKFMILDSDGSHDPNKIPEINTMYKMQKCDIVIGSRYTNGGKTNDKMSSVIMSKILNFAFRLCLGIKAKDISTDFRMYSTEQLKQIDLTNKNYDVLQEVLLKMKLNNPSLVIGEVPIVFTKRVFGESKRRLIPFILDYIKSLFKLTCLRFPSLKNLIFYGLFGLLGAMIEYSAFYLLTAIHFSDRPEIANVLAALFGFIFTFLTNTFLNFQKRDKVLKRLISYGTICICGILFSTIMIYICKPYANIYVLKLGLLIFVSLIQFIINKNITYK